MKLPQRAKITEIWTVHTQFWKPNRTTTTTRLWRRWNYRNLDLHIFESQTEQLLWDFEGDEITEIRTVHAHFWKPNRTTSMRLWRWRNYRNLDLHIFESQREQLLRDFEVWRRRNYRNLDCPYTFLKAKRNNNCYEALKTMKLPKFGPTQFWKPNRTTTTRLEGDEITEIRTVHAHFRKPNRTTTMRLWRWWNYRNLDLHIFESQREQLLRDFEVWRRRNYRNLDQTYTFLKAKRNNH